MAHTIKYSSWQSPTGYWYCNDTSNLAAGSGEWWIPARILGISPADFIELLVKDFKPDHISFNKILIFSWKDQSKMRAYKNWINAQARKVNFQI